MGFGPTWELLQVMAPIILVACGGAIGALIYINRMMNGVMNELRVLVREERAARSEAMMAVHDRISRLQDSHNLHVKEVARDYPTRAELSTIIAHVDTLIGEVRKSLGRG